MPSSALAIAMQRAMNATLATEDVARIVVASAVDETIRAISLEYGLNPDTIRRDHLERIVEKYATFDERGCMQKTTRGNVCARPALCGSTCHTHLHLAPQSTIIHKKPRVADHVSKNAAWVHGIISSLLTKEKDRGEDGPS